MTDSLFARPRIRISGDRAFLVEYGDTIDCRVNEKVRAMTELLRKAAPEGVDLILPAYRSIGIMYDPLKTSHHKICTLLSDLEAHMDEAVIPEPRTVDIPVCYGGQYGPDIEFVAAHNHLSVDEVIRIHTTGPYRIYTIGFAPGFFYLGGLDPRLHTPRMETPRTMVPAGSVGIAETQTGAYPLDSPGGWQIIGRTPVKLFDAKRKDPFFYQAGDSIRFKAISPAEYGGIATGKNI
ncbi:MAG: 5-oxoprolinase subunit PxpB [Desulfosalsimonadaceae bacterium]